jgi:exodeoxyribonuclease VII large subunit
MPSEFFRVSEINQCMKDVLNAGFPQAVWICGELQQYDRNKTKSHVFFELVEKDETTHEIVARIGLVIFANRRPAIDAKLKKADNAFELKDDIEVKFACRVDFYPPHGSVRLIVEDIDPVYTLGKLAQERQKVIASLKAKGVLDKNKQREFPLIPLRIGLITAYDSAAYNDFISELRRSGFGFKIYLRSAVMQGKKTEADVAAAIDDLHALGELDVIVITRGGGSIAELSCFDSAVIAERIAASRLPVISGIGHEINTTITDLAAHTFLKTPTAVAQFLVEGTRRFIDGLEAQLQELTRVSRFLLDQRHQSLRHHGYLLQSATISFLKEHREESARLSEGLRQKAETALKNECRALKENEDAILMAMSRRLKNERMKIQSHSKVLAAYHPDATLKRGFSITRDQNGKALKNIEGIHPGEIIATEIFKGSIRSVVKSIKEEKE